jgi:glutathione S-transferase
MKLYAHKVSNTSRPVLLFAAESKIPLELVVVDLMTGEHTKEPFAKMNPSKQVPVLDDDGFILTESSSILKYLADKVNSPAYPKDLKKRAHVNEMMDWFNTGYYREWGYHLIYPQVYPHHKRPTDEINTGTVEWGKKQAEFWLGVLDKHWLGKGNKYVCGNEMTIADYFGAPLMQAGELVGAVASGYPNITKWMNLMRALPNWKQVSEVHEGFAGSLKGQKFVNIA